MESEEVGDVEPAIDLADNGYVVADVIADMWRREENKLRQDVDARRIFLNKNNAYKKGEIHKQKELAETLRSIAKYGRDGFYSGYVADDMIKKLRKLGGQHSGKFISFEAEYVEPININYKGYNIYECPPNGQGIVALMMFNMLSKLDLKVLMILEEFT